MITGVSHIAIAVRSLEETIPFYRDILGMTLEGIEVVPDQKVKVAFFLAGQTRIELLEATSEDSPISKFVAERGGGIHHLALRTEDVSAEIARLEKEEKRLQGELKRSAGMLTNEKFLAKAPAAKIEAEREKQRAYEEQMKGVREELENLKKLG